MTEKERTRRTKAAPRSLGLTAPETFSAPAAAGKFDIDKVREEEIARTGGPAGGESRKFAPVLGGSADQRRLPGLRDSQASRRLLGVFFESLSL
jgi:hypothetical protein